MRSEILRTGTIVGNSSSSSVLASNGCDDTGPGTSDAYELLAPLDALKEISRKRIHCDVSVRVPSCRLCRRLHSAVFRVNRNRRAASTM